MTSRSWYRLVTLVSVACSGTPTPPPSNVAPPSPSDAAAAKYFCLGDMCIDKDMCEMWRGNAALMEPDQPLCVQAAVVYCHDGDCYRTRNACEHDNHRCVEQH